MQIDEKKIKEILLRQNYISPENLKRAEEFSREHHISIIDYLTSEGLINRNILGQTLAESFSVPYVDLNTNQPHQEQVLKISEALAKEKRVVLFREDEKSVVVATDNPTQKDLVQELGKIFPGKNVTLAYAMSEDIEQTFYNYRQSLEARFIKIIKDQKRIAPSIIEEIIEDALATRASDIHFEPLELEVNVRFRVDGVLQEVGRIPKDQYSNILNRIKVQAHLRIDEHFAAQDGAIRYIKNGRVTDLRISIVPTLDGEKVAIRVLAEYVRGFTLSDLGLSVTDQNIITESAKKPFGMILVTGPTGSGKTTTLYALIKILNKPEVHIMTIEDPVEYKIVGVNQIQVNRQTDLTFSKGLPSILRQDPNIILVGEIRGPDTAEIAVNAALTGHLLLSTFHANDASTAIPRLIDMHVEPFLIASTLELIVAQRLVRKICENCRSSVSVTKDDLARISPNLLNYFPKDVTTLYKGKGCGACTMTGYRGRTAVFEFIQINQQIQDLILHNPSSQQIFEVAKKRPGFHTLFEDGIEKVKSGLTTIEELLRVVSSHS
ncbi:MAG: Flp pilus assembly complex ATPase component TadA [Candidatus Liptonbacteria bacterium]|nr:Flp pilus assembly complex ATPase component TadA [Candidatus Liptonbacteria bacterium]